MVHYQAQINSDYVIFIYLHNNMTIHSSMATKAPVLRPAEDRKAWAWQTLLLMRPLVLFWHTQTLRESVAVLLRGGSPPSATTSTRLKNSWSLSWLKPSRRRDTMLAVLSGSREGRVKNGVVAMDAERQRNGRRLKGMPRKRNKRRQLYLFCFSRKLYLRKKLSIKLRHWSIFIYIKQRVEQGHCL